MKLPAYPRTKPSGVEWLGDVPEHWEVKKLGYGARLQGGYAFASDKFDSEGVAVVRMNNLKRGVLDVSQASCIAQENCLNDFALAEGDLLWGMSGSIGETGSLGNFARVRSSDLPAQLNQRVGRFCTTGDTSSLDFLTYVIQTKLFYDQILLRVTGTAQFNVSSEQVQSARIPFPHLAEQQAIAAFLNRETGRVDRLVAKKRELIERLKEKRTALISRTVTRGLPPAAARAAGLPANPPLKPSGIEWIGDVPERWEVLRFRNIIIGGVTNGLFKTQDAFGDGTRLINVYDAYRFDFNIDEQSLERVATTAAELRLYRVQSGDVFFVRSSLKLEGVGRAVCCLNPTEDLVFECHLVRACPDLKKIHPRFLILFLNSQFVVHSLIAAAKTTTMATISQPRMLDLPVLLPALPEQAAIAAYLDEETAKLDALVGKVEEAVERLQEYRTALITAAVTGKIDVRP